MQTLNMQTAGKYRIALLIDAENKSSKNFNNALASLSSLGQVILIRAYACWEKSNPKSWTPLFETGIVEKRNLRKSIPKNAADKTLIYEAAELIIAGKLDAIALYSGDGDFEMAIETWKGQGVKIICFNKMHVSKAILENADYIISEETGRIESTIKPLNNPEQQIIKRVRNVILPGPKVIGKIQLPVAEYKLTNGTKDALHGLKGYVFKKLEEYGGKMLVSEMGALIRTQFPAFTPTAYKCKKLTAFLRQYLPEVNLLLAHDYSTYWIEIKSK